MIQTLQNGKTEKKGNELHDDEKKNNSSWSVIVRFFFVVVVVGYSLQLYYVVRMINLFSKNFRCAKIKGNNRRKKK